MTAGPGPTWREAPPASAPSGLWATIVQLVGYTTGLIFIHHTTGMTPPGVAEQYRGTDSTAVSDAAMKFPKSYAEMLNITHTHLLEHGGDLHRQRPGAGACASGPRRVGGRLLVVEPFVALLVSFSSMWLMRYVDARFSWLLSLSSGLMALTFYVQSFFILRELAGLRGTA